MANNFLKQLQESTNVENGESVVIRNTVIAPSGEPAVDIFGNNARLRVRSNGSVLANDEGNTAVQVSGNNDRIFNFGLISGALNGISSSGDGLSLINRGTITSDSRAVDLSDGDGIRVFNTGRILGTGNQRNGTLYINGVVDNAIIKNGRFGLIDAGFGNTGDGISVQVGSSNGDLVNENIDIVNKGFVFGRGQAAFDEGRLNANGSSGIRFFNGSGEPEATVIGSVRNSGLITAEVDVGFLGGVVVEDGVGFVGTIENQGNGRIFAPRNGLYIGDGNHDLKIKNSGLISSDSRVVNLDGDNVKLHNNGFILGTDNQRNGTLYVDGTADNITINNKSLGIIDAGIGNLGDGIAVQVGASSEDSVNHNIDIVNQGFIFGRGQAAFDGGRLAPNGSSGVRFFNGSGEPEATVIGSLRNSGLITTEVDVGFLGGVVVEDGIGFVGTIENQRRGQIIAPRNGLYIGDGEHDLTINNDGLISSGSRVINLDGDNVRLNNDGLILGIDNQRNGTLYVDGTGDNIDINNERFGVIDAGLNNSGSGISVQVGAVHGLGEGIDDLETITDITNEGKIQGRGDSNVPAGIRLFLGSGLTQATFSGDIINERQGLIASEQDAGILIESGVVFDGKIVNDGKIKGGNGLAIDGFGALGNIEVINNGTLVGAVNLGEGDDSLIQNSRQGINVNGFGGDDLLAGGRGDDTLTGGEGNDIFRFDRNSGTDIITDFETVDILDVSDIFSDVNQILGVDGVISQVGNDVLINFGRRDSLTLENFEVSDLSEDNFLV